MSDNVSSEYVKDLELCVKQLLPVYEKYHQLTGLTLNLPKSIVRDPRLRRTIPALLKPPQNVQETTDYDD